MPPKKQVVKKIEDDESLLPYLSETLQQLVIIDLYAPWTGPCETMKEYYKSLCGKFEDFEDRCEILQVKQGKISHFTNYSMTSRPRFLFVLKGKVVQEVRSVNTLEIDTTINKFIPA